MTTPKRSSELTRISGGNERETTAQSAVFVFNCFMVIFCIGLIVTYIVELATGTSKHPSSDPGLIVFLMGVVFLCGRGIRLRLKERDAVRQLHEEQSVLRCARACPEGLTIAQVSLDCKMRIVDTRKALDRLTITGICQVDVSEEGELLYRFPALIAQKRSDTD